jgi:hypothetical protein
MAWNNFQSLRGRLYDILFQGHISINLSPWLAFEIALTAAFLSTAGRGEWDNWAIGINAHKEVLKWKHPFHAYFQYKSIHPFEGAVKLPKL